MLDLRETKKRNLTSSAILVGLSTDEKERLQEQFVRARPFLKHITKLLDKEMERTIREEEQSSADMNTIMKMIGRRSGLRYIKDLINK